MFSLARIVEQGKLPKKKKNPLDDSVAIRNNRVLLRDLPGELIKTKKKKRYCFLKSLRKYYFPIDLPLRRFRIQCTLISCVCVQCVTHCTRLSEERLFLEKKKKKNVFFSFVFTLPVLAVKRIRLFRFMLLFLRARARVHLIACVYRI